MQSRGTRLEGSFAGILAFVRNTRDNSAAVAADIRRTRHIGDFRGWKSHDKYRKAFERLMRDLKAEEKKK